MFFLRMAARNIFRQYGRTTLSMMSIIFGVAVIIASRGLTAGFKENIIRAQVDTFSGHVQALPADYPEAAVQRPVDELLTLDDATRAWLDANTAGWTRRVLFTPRAVKGSDAIRVPAFGFDPATDARVFPRDQWRLDGRIPETAADGILVSNGLKDILGLTVGGTMVLEVRTAAGAINALEVPISGAVTTGSPMIDHLGIFVPWPLTQELVRTGDQLTQLSVRLNDRGDSDAVAEELRRLMGAQARVSTWYEDTKSLVELQDIRQFMFDVLAAALVAIAATGIANTVLMAAYERVREVGTLRAMGMTQAGVLRLFLTEGLVMGTVGSLVGAALGGGIVWKYAQDGIDLSPMISGAAQSGQYNNVPFSSMLYLQFSESTVAAAFVFGLVVAVVASIYPARLASAMPPAEAVRAE